MTDSKSSVVNHSLSIVIDEQYLCVDSPSTQLILKPSKIHEASWALALVLSKLVRRTGTERNPAPLPETTTPRRFGQNQLLKKVDHKISIRPGPTYIMAHKFHFQ